jgi:hypothetical protein
MRIEIPQSSTIAARLLKRVSQMNQIKSMVTLASMAAHEISLRNGAGSLSIIWVLVAGRVIVAIRALLFGINV